MTTRLIVLALALLILVGSAMGAAPTVDFNWVGTGNYAGETTLRLNVDFNFQPQISTTSDLNILYWDFGDYNINYNLNEPTLGGYYDNFEDGRLDFNMAWDVNYQLVGSDWNIDPDGNLTYTGTGSAAISTDFNVSPDRNTTWEFVINRIGGSTGNTFFWFMGQRPFKGYNVRLEDIEGFRKILLRKDSTTLFECGTILKGNSIALRIDRNANGQFQVYKADAATGEAFSNCGGFLDTTYTTSDYMVLFHDNDAAGATTTFDDLNVTQYVNHMKGEITQVNNFTNEICLTAGNNDGNTTTCKPVDWNGEIQISFFDENTFEAITPDTVEVNGIEQTLTSNVLTFPLAGYSDSNFEVVARKDGMTERSWYFVNLGPHSLVDINAFLLDTNKGKEIEFKMFDPDQTTILNNAIVSMMRSDTNFASIKEVETDGTVRFFVNDDANYTLDIDINKDGISDYNYTPVVLSILVPLDEQDGTTITPFRAITSGIGSTDLNNQSSTATQLIFPNTVDFYQVRISQSSGTGYSFSRTYLVRVRGNPGTHELQSYLASDDDDTFNSSLQTVELISQIPMPNILITATTSTANGVQTVESRRTDSTGKTLFAFILNKDYTLTFDQNSLPTTRVGSVFINAQSSTYRFGLNLISSDFNLQSSGGVDINYGQVILHNERFDINFNLRSIQFPIQSYIWKVYTNDGNTLYDSGVVGVNNFTATAGQTIEYSRLDYNTLITSQVVVTLDRGATTFDVNLHRTFSLLSGTEINVFESMSSLRRFFGDFGSTLMAVVLGLVAIGFISNNQMAISSNGMYVMFLGIVGVFVFFDMVSVFNFAFAAFFGTMAWIYANRGS